jgi:hypothetical protein
MERLQSYIRKIWLDFTGRPLSNITDVDNVFICSLHFDKPAYDQSKGKTHNGSLLKAGGRILRDDAIPTINIPHIADSAITAALKRIIYLKNWKPRPDNGRELVLRYYHYTRIIDGC